MQQLSPKENTYFRMTCAYLKATGAHNKNTLAFCQRNGIDPDVLLQRIQEKQLMEKEEVFAEHHRRLERAGLL